MKKKLLSLILIAALGASVVGCGSKGGTASIDGEDVPKAGEKR